MEIFIGILFLFILAGELVGKIVGSLIRKHRERAYMRPQSRYYTTF